MTAIVPHPARWTPELVPTLAAMPAPDRAARPALPPREVWPLLCTIAATELLMLALIAWYAVAGA